MMISDKYKQIEDMINGNEKTLISVVEVCDKICNENVNLKKIAELVFAPDNFWSTKN